MLRAAATIWAVRAARGSRPQLLKVQLPEELYGTVATRDGGFLGRPHMASSQWPRRAWGHQERHDHQDDHHWYSSNPSHHRYVYVLIVNWSITAATCDPDLAQVEVACWINRTTDSLLFSYVLFCWTLWGDESCMDCPCDAYIKDIKAVLIVAVSV